MTVIRDGKNECSREKMIGILERILAGKYFEHVTILNTYKAEVPFKNRTGYQAWNRISVVLDGCSLLECGEGDHIAVREFPAGTVQVMKPFALVEPCWGAGPGRVAFGIVCRSEYLRLMYTDNMPDNHPVMAPDCYYHIYDTVRKCTVEAIGVLCSLEEGPETEALVAPLMTTICTMVLNDLKDSRQPETSRSYDLWGRIQEYVAELPPDRCTRRSVSRHFNITETYVSYLFSQYSGMTFTEYARKKAIEKATFLLKTTDMPVKEIADTCGFCSPSHFIRVFRQAHQVTPVTYRRLKK